MLQGEKLTRNLFPSPLMDQNWFQLRKSIGRARVEAELNLRANLPFFPSGDLKNAKYTPWNNKEQEQEH